MTLPLRVVLPFIAVTLIWGSTWIVILDQLGPVPPSWSVAYRFVIAALAMFAYALATRTPLAIGRGGQALALLLGVAQFALNYNSVYLAELYITSGVVAVAFASLLVFNALLGRVFLGQRTTRGFVIGSAIMMAGIALLFLNEWRVMTARPAEVAIGLGFTLLAIVAASVANVMQASERARALPIASLLAWGMLWGALIDIVWAWAIAGPPVIEARAGYWIGLVYLGAIASALAFMLYYGVIRAIGPARAAYSSVLVPVIAMALSSLFEGYRWSGWAIAGAGLVLAGLTVALSLREGPRKARPFGRSG